MLYETFSVIFKQCVLRNFFGFKQLADHEEVNKDIEEGTYKA